MCVYRTGCTFEQIWDIEEPSLKNEPKLCEILLRGFVEHLYPVYKNPEYTILKVHDYSVRYIPRIYLT